MSLSSGAVARAETETPEALLERAEELLRAVRFVGDEEDLYFWRIRRTDWVQSLAAHGGPSLAAPSSEGLGLTATLSGNGLSLTAELSRDVAVIKKVIAQIEGEIDEAAARLRPVIEAGC